MRYSDREAAPVSVEVKAGGVREHGVLGDPVDHGSGLADQAPAHEYYGGMGVMHPALGSTSGAPAEALQPEPESHRQLELTCPACKTLNRFIEGPSKTSHRCTNCKTEMPIPSKSELAGKQREQRAKQH